MGWLTDDGRHEGYAAALFADGMMGGSYSGQGVLVGLDADGRYLSRERREDEDWRPYQDVVGWRMMCDCYSSAGGLSTAWSGPIWTRVPNVEDEDLAARRVHAPGDDIHIEYRDDVETLLLADWRAHVNPLEATTKVREAAAAARQADRELDRAVVAARLAGATWADIGRATGMARQSAHERWFSRDLAGGN